MRGRRFPAAFVRLGVALAALGGALIGAGAATDPPEQAPMAASPVATATPVPPSSLQRALPKVAEQLVAARRAGRRRLSSGRSPREQERAANALAGAYRRAAIRLAAPAKEAGEGELLATLERAGRAYAALAVAARRGDRRAYDRARDAIAATERRLPRAFTRALSH